MPRYHAKIRTAQYVVVSVEAESEEQVRATFDEDGRLGALGHVEVVRETNRSPELVSVWEVPDAGA